MRTEPPDPESIVRHYRTMRAPESLVRRITALESSAQAEGHQRRSRRRRRNAAGVAVAILLAAGATAILHQQAGRPETPHDGVADAADRDGLAERLVAEAAANHLAMLPADVRTPDLAALEEALGPLPFRLAPLAPRLKQDALKDGFNLLGARPCKLAGEPAVQLNYTTSDGRSMTVLVAAADQRTNELQPGRHPTGDNRLEVGIWLHEDRVFTVTRDLDAQDQDGSAPSSKPPGA